VLGCAPKSLCLARVGLLDSNTRCLPKRRRMTSGYSTISYEVRLLSEISENQYRDILEKHRHKLCFVRLQNDKIQFVTLVVTLRRYISRTIYSASYSAKHTMFDAFYYLPCKFSDQTPHISIVQINEMRRRN
jgi:hypothetical protein